MLDGFSSTVGVRSVATAALKVALVQQSQFEKVLKDTVDRKREEAEELRETTELPKDKVVVEAAAVKDAEPVASVPVESAEPVRGESVNIEV